MNGRTAPTRARPQQATLDTPSAATWQSLKYAGEQGTAAIFFALRPGSRVQVRVEYDRATGQATSQPNTPELAALAPFAVLVLREHASLRALRLDDAKLAAMTTSLERCAETLPDDELTRAMVAACHLETRKRAAQGPGLREALAQPDDAARRSAVRALTDMELFGA